MKFILVILIIFMIVACTLAVIDPLAALIGIIFGLLASIPASKALLLWISNND